MIDDASSVDNDDVAGDNAMTIPIMIIDHAGDHVDCCDEDAHDDDLDEDNDGDDLNHDCDDDTYDDDDLDPKSSPLFPLKGWKSKGRQLDLV